MAKKTLTSGLLGTVTGLSKEAESVSTNSAVAPVEMPKEVAPEIPGQSDKRDGKPPPWRRDGGVVKLPSVPRRKRVRGGPNKR